MLANDEIYDVLDSKVDISPSPQLHREQRRSQIPHPPPSTFALETVPIIIAIIVFIIASVVTVMT